MSSYHILNSNGSGSSYRTRIEYHIDVPVEINPFTSEDDYLRTRLAGDDDFNKLSEDPDIAPAEQVNITQGEILIVRESIGINGDRADHLTLLDQQAEARTLTLRVEAIDGLRDRYRYTSLTRDVA